MFLRYWGKPLNVGNDGMWNVGSCACFFFLLETLFTPQASSHSVGTYILGM